MEDTSAIVSVGKAFLAKRKPSGGSGRYVCDDSRHPLDGSNGVHSMARLGKRVVGVLGEGERIVEIERREGSAAGEAEKATRQSSGSNASLSLSVLWPSK